MDAIEDRLRNLRTADMTGSLELPSAPSVMRRATVRRQRRRAAAAVLTLATSTAVVAAVIGIATRDDTPDRVRTVDDPPPTVTFPPTTTSTTTSTTSSTTSTTVADRAPTLRPPDSPTPAAGTCGHNPAAVVEAEMLDDVPRPRCLQVLAHQRLQLRNGLSVPITVSIADFTAVIQPGEAHLFDRPFGDYLQLGVHRLDITHDLPDANTSGPEIFLVDDVQDP